MLTLLIWLLVFAVIVFLVFYIIDQLPLPPPIPVIAKCILAVVFLIILIDQFVPLGVGGPRLIH